MNDDPATKSIPPGGDESSPTPEPASFQLKPGDRVGNYVIREQIGEGGFAIVYAAEQEKPVRRKVALKIIKLGMDTKQVIARFEAERQALAMMDHPNVAKVFDAGATETGRPYFVMEYIAGTPINEYCDRQRLTIEERLGLFTQVCDGVQHAHQKGIIHRDIKPSNVLVTVKEGEPQVKVIDFGVAKAITQRLTEKTIYTEQGQLIGTPEYMSPEQAEMAAEDIDTRSDIYSLGVLLYELLTGALPFDPTTLRQAAFGEIQRIIREEEPPKPSTRLSSLGDDSAPSAKLRRVDPKSLYRELRGDLDWIVMKSLEKDRTRRYASASELARDVFRHLSADPIEAAPPSIRYRMSRSVRKNKVILNGGVLMGLVMLLFMALTIWVGWSTGARSNASNLINALWFISFPIGLLIIAFLLWRINRGRFSGLNLILGGILVFICLMPLVLPISMSPGVTPLQRALYYLQLERLDDAAMVYADLLTDYERRWGISDSRTRDVRLRLAAVCRQLERFDEAEVLYLKSLMANEHARANDLIDLYDAWGKPEKAAEWRAKLPTEQDAVASDPPVDEKRDVGPSGD